MNKIFPLLLILLLFNCTEKAKKLPIEKAFYYWQTRLNNDRFPGADALTEIGVNKLYVRCFDIDWSESAKAPVKEGSITDFPVKKGSLELVPVVFITNKTFKNLSLVESEEMAVMTYRHLMESFNTIIGIPEPYSDYYDYEHDPYKQYSSDFNEIAKRDSLYNSLLSSHLKEIQFDCDWTASTRDNYFAFLEKMKSLFTGKLISCTVRLYPFKYPEKAGIPPVDKGMLMCYNAGNIRDTKTANSIFDKKEVLSYLKNANTYPLPLDAALPMFSWGVHFSGKELKNIVSIDQLSQYSRFLHTEGNIITVKQDFNFGHDYRAIYLRKGDKIRIEETNLNEVKEITSELRKHLSPSSTVAFYHITKYAFEKNKEKIEDIFYSF